MKCWMNERNNNNNNNNYCRFIIMKVSRACHIQIIDWIPIIFGWPQCTSFVGHHQFCGGDGIRAVESIATLFICRRIFSHHFSAKPRSGDCACSKKKHMDNQAINMIAWRQATLKHYRPIENVSGNTKSNINANLMKQFIMSNNATINARTLARDLKHDSIA